MGFFSKIKNKLGIGGVKVSLQIPGQVAKEANEVEGKITLTTKSEQEVVSIEVKFLEEFTTGRGDSKSTKEFELGTVKLPESFSIKPGDTKEISFKVPFELLKSSSDRLADRGGAVGALGKLGKMAGNEKSAYFVEAEVDVKSAVLDPSDKKDIKLV